MQKVEKANAIYKNVLQRISLGYVTCIDTVVELDREVMQTLARVALADVERIQGDEKNDPQ